MTPASTAPMAAPGAVGIFGGTFDPIHLAHLRLAEEVADRLGLAQVRFIPSNIPPHRASPSVTPQHRLQMVNLAIRGNPRFALDDRECRRAGASYTVDTLREVRVEIGSAAPMYLLMGMDAYNLLTTWSRWRELYALAHIVIAHRPGHLLDLAALDDDLARETGARLADANDLARAPAGKVTTLDIPALDISATGIRARLRAGHSVRYLLPADVLDYIELHHLYKDLDAGRGD